MDEIKSLLNNFYSLSWLDKSIALLVVIFPAVDATFKHSGTLVYTLLLLLGLFFGLMGKLLVHLIRIQS